MNERVRTYLIEIARRREKFVFYSDLVKDCELNLNLGTEHGKHQLSIILSDVAKFEDQQGRPLLSALAIYKDERKNDHADGFYKLAETLGKGDFKKLKREFFGISEAENCRQFWKNEDNYFHYAVIKGKTVHNAGKEVFSSFAKGDIGSYFKEVMYRPEYYWIQGWAFEYRAFVNDIEIVRHNMRLHPSLPIDDVIIYHGLSALRSNDYNSFMRKWLKERENGIASRGQSILSQVDFDTIIIDKDFMDIAKNVIMESSLITYNELSSWWQNMNMFYRPLLINRAMAAVLPEKLSTVVDYKKFWQIIKYLESNFGFSFNENPQWSWFSANVQLTSWLDNSLKQELEEYAVSIKEKYIWRNIFVWLIYYDINPEDTIRPNQLLEKAKPEGLDSMPQSERTFGGVNIDFIERNKELKILGDAGEELVIQKERAFLLMKGRPDLAEKVRSAEDGNGYDILSFDENDNKRFIEVKTTIGGANAAFFLTENEVAFMKQNMNNYYIYRIYNYNAEKNSGYFFRLEGDIEKQLIMQPIQYKVVIAKEK